MHVSFLRRWAMIGLCGEEWEAAGEDYEYAMALRLSQLGGCDTRRLAPATGRTHDGRGYAYITMKSRLFRGAQGATRALANQFSGASQSCWCNCLLGGYILRIGRATADAKA